jgi:acylphosphatase
MSKDFDRAVSVRITGRVQGVCYRSWTVQRARAHGLSGWVRNRSDGSVEALFAGAAAEVEGMVAECRRGPPAARVDRVAIAPAAAPANQGFAEWPSA